MLRFAKTTVCRLYSPNFYRSMAKSTKIDPKRCLVWVDLEMSGLDVEKDRILEFACIITDKHLNVIAEGPNVVIKQPDELLENMHPWCITHHGRSGLTQAVRDSQISLKEAEDMALYFVQQYVPANKCPLAGNSIHSDKVFLDRYMPNFMSHLHYRIVDVSTIKELCRRWYIRDYGGKPKKALGHRALDDIRESIEELRYYRAAIFKEKKHHTDSDSDLNWSDAEKADDDAEKTNDAEKTDDDAEKTDDDAEKTNDDIEKTKDDNEIANDATATAPK